MPFQQDLTGSIEPTAKTWQDATPAQRLWYYQQMAKLAERRKRVELMQAIGRYGTMDPRKHARADGASGPVMDPHGAASRAYKLLASSATARGCKLFWRAGAAIVSKKGVIYMPEVLGYHADGLVRGAPVRDVRLSDDSIASLQQEGESVWRKRPKQSGPKPPPPAPVPTKVSTKGPTQVGGNPFKTILPPKTPKVPKQPKVSQAKAAADAKRAEEAARVAEAARRKAEAEARAAADRARLEAAQEAARLKAEAEALAKKKAEAEAAAKARAAAEAKAKAAAEAKARAEADAAAKAKAEADAAKKAAEAKAKAATEAKAKAGAEALAKKAAEAAAKAGAAGPSGPILPGRPIAERLKAYTAGDAKVAKLAEAGRREAEARAKYKALDDERAKLLGQFAAAGNDPGFPGAARLKQIIEVDLVQATKERRAAIDASGDLSGIFAAKDPMKVAMNTDDLTPQQRRVVDEAKGWLDRVVERGGARPVAVSIEAIPDGSPIRSQVNEKGTRMLLEQAAQPWVVVHETGHILEAQLEASGGGTVLQRGLEFLRYRVGDEVPRRMADVFPDSNYMAHEYGRKDHFDDHFNLSFAYYTGKDYGDRATEILAMGMQALHKDPGKFAADDPEFAKFVLGILDGSLR